MVAPGGVFAVARLWFAAIHCYSGTAAPPGMRDLRRAIHGPLAVLGSRFTAGIVGGDQFQNAAPFMGLWLVALARDQTAEAGAEAR